MILIIILIVYLVKHNKSPTPSPTSSCEYAGDDVNKMSTSTLNDFFAAFTTPEHLGRFGTQGQIDFDKCQRGGFTKPEDVQVTIMP